jgi:hypothetical protein
MFIGYKSKKFGSIRVTIIKIEGKYISLINHSESDVVDWKTAVRTILFSHTTDLKAFNEPLDAIFNAKMKIKFLNNKTDEEKKHFDEVLKILHEMKFVYEDYDLLYNAHGVNNQTTC